MKVNLWYKSWCPFHLVTIFLAVSTLFNECGKLGEKVNILIKINILAYRSDLDSEVSFKYYPPVFIVGY